MAAQIPEQEPTTVTAGDTVKWTRSFSDFPAGDGWVLSYSFLRIGLTPSPPIAFNSTASGNKHLISLNPGDTELWLDGEYNGQGYVTKATERYLVWQGSWIVQLNFASQTGSVDTRTKARKILDFIDDSFEAVVKKQVVEATIEGVSLTFRSIPDLIDARNYWGPVVSAEEAAMGTGKKRAILAVFSSPQ